LVLNQECEQPKICAEIFKNIDDRFKVLHHRADDLDEKTEEINNINNVLVRLETLVSLQREDGIKRDKLIADINENQTKISNSLDILSNRINNTEVSVEKLNKKIDEVSNDNKMKVSDIIKNLIILGLSMGFGAIIGLVIK
jgi:uncharacterized protein (DUF342 family)